MYNSFTTVDRILAKLSRELSETDFNEKDVIEMIGEALDFMKYSSNLEPIVTFRNVINYQCDIPKYCHFIQQIARDNSNTNLSNYSNNLSKELIKEEVISYSDCCGKEDIIITNKTYNRSMFDFGWSYNNWIKSNYYKNRFTPVRLSNSTLFKINVCKEKNIDYESCKDEYNIIGTINQKLRFSFMEGVVAISYLRSAIDKETGYPLIPDNPYVISAITYYIKWKIAEDLEWKGREGFSRLSQDNERKYMSYVKKAKNDMKMPKTIDDYQDLLEQSFSTVPNDSYYSFFGNLNTY